MIPWPHLIKTLIGRRKKAHGRCINTHVLSSFNKTNIDCVGRDWCWGYDGAAYNDRSLSATKHPVWWSLSSRASLLLRHDKRHHWRQTTFWGQLTTCIDCIWFVKWNIVNPVIKKEWTTFHLLSSLWNSYYNGDHHWLKLEDLFA